MEHQSFSSNVQLRGAKEMAKNRIKQDKQDSKKRPILNNFFLLLVLIKKRLKHKIKASKSLKTAHFLAKLDRPKTAQTCPLFKKLPIFWRN